MDLSKRVAADSGLEHFWCDPCAVFGRNVGLDLSTRVEATESGLGSLQVGKQVGLCSLSSPGLDLYVDSCKGVDAGMGLHSFCLVEKPWSVLDPTVNMVSRVDDLQLLSAAHSRHADTMAHSTLCACKSDDMPRKRCVEVLTENVSIGHEPDSDE